MKKMLAYFILVTICITCIGCNYQTNNKVDNEGNSNEINQNPSFDDFTGSDSNSPTTPNEELNSPDNPQAEPEKIYLSYAVSTTDALRVRSKPNSSSLILGYLDKNDAVSILDIEGNYYKTVYKEQTAYVYKSYCKIMKIERTDDKSEKAIELGSTLLGYPYVWGSQRYHWGNGKLNSNFVLGEFDCSSLVQYVYFKSNNVILDLTTRTQVDYGTTVDKKDLKRGDLIFFTNSSRKNLSGKERIGHVGIYFGNNYILHTASDHAVIEPISDLRWSYYITSKRIV